ncbi:MAG: TlpA family protein disulfide reductase [Acidimicrobiales bacterium]
MACSARPNPGATLSPGPDAGRKPPTFVLSEVRDGRPPVALDALAGHGRPLLVNFWSSTCIPCRKEMPTLEAAYRRAGGRVGFVGVDEEDERAPAQRLMAATGVTYASGYDRDGALSGKWGLVGLPTTVVLGADGVVAGRVLGPLDRAGLDRILAKLDGARGNGKCKDPRGDGPCP